MIGEGETVTFRGRHFGVQLQHTSRVEELRPFNYFRDVMVAGAFRHFVHDHHFAAMDDGTRMRDEIWFSAPWGPLGQIVARRRLKAFLLERNAAIKRVAESEEWRRYLGSGVDGLTAVGDATHPWAVIAPLRNSAGVAAPGPPQG